MILLAKNVYQTVNKPEESNLKIVKKDRKRLYWESCKNYSKLYYNI